MKHYILIYLTFFISLNLVSQTTHTEIRYSLKLNTQNNNHALISAFENQTFVLQSDGEATIFFSNKKITKDDNINNNLARMYSGANNKFYTNSKTHKNIKQTEAYGEHFLIDISENSKNWTLTKDTKNIAGYKCFKAHKIIEQTNYKGEKKEIKTTAWFTNNININSGPMGYSGLPGLILELQLANIIYYATHIKHLTKNTDIKAPTKGKEISEKEFEDIGKQIYINRKQM